MRLMMAGLTLVMLCVADVYAQGVRLGPTDTNVLSPTDTGRVVVGTPAPDFVLAALDGSLVRLSQFRGNQTVVLVFYRGFW